LAAADWIKIYADSWDPKKGGADVHRGRVETIVETARSAGCPVVARDDEEGMRRRRSGRQETIGTATAACGGVPLMANRGVAAVSDVGRGRGDGPLSWRAHRPEAEPFRSLRTMFKEAWRQA
jgi:hypothetical protein